MKTGCVALIGDQANEALRKPWTTPASKHTYPMANPAPYTFADTFFWKDGNATIISPTRIYLEPWDDDDRPRQERQVAGWQHHSHQSAQRRTGSRKRRGKCKTIGRASADEVLREIEEWSTISKALGDALRGPNEYVC